MKRHRGNKNFNVPAKKVKKADKVHEVEVVKEVAKKEEKKKATKEVIEVPKSPTSKKVFGTIKGSIVAEWDSITKCADALGLTRAIIKKHIDSGEPLESGYILTLTN